MDLNAITEDTNILLEVGTNELEILEFYIEETAQDGAPGERIFFGMNVAKVMQVIEQPDVADRAHNQHPSFLGVIPLREHVLPLIDLGNWLGLKRRRSPEDVVIVTEFSRALTGFLVSGVTEIHRVGWDDVASPSGYLAHVAIGSLIGTVQHGDRIVQLLDLESVLADLDPASMASAVESTVKASRPYRILVADDSPTIRFMLEQNLRSANLVPQITDNGRAALAALAELKTRAEAEGKDIREFVDAVVADIEMPQMDGFSLTKQIKQDPVLGQLPVLLYSSIITAELRHKGESVGADDQVSKPDLHTMAARIIELIEAR